MEIRDTCLCGAEFRASGSEKAPGTDEPQVRRAHEAWLRQHGVCREVRIEYRVSQELDEGAKAVGLD